ncbi:zinc finger protein 233-like [Pseudochaenichthys georgianus]|uniref:zinc finger protein 233-like n=1 Tax=Pseudochaenichthys georgianus TaxID=52239 RepID=UPI0039C2F80C
MRHTRPNNADELKAASEATWASITPQQCHRLIVSMPHRIDAVIHAKGDVQQLVVVKEEVPPEQQEWSSSLDQEDPEPPPHIKEEQEELWSSQEGEQLQGLEEADITKSTFIPVPVKSEDDEEQPQSSQLHQIQTEHLETEADGVSSQLHQTQTEENREAEPPASNSAEHIEKEADGEDCGGPEPARNSDPERHLQPETEDNPGDSSETEDSEDDDFWKQSSEGLSVLSSLKHTFVHSDETFNSNHQREELFTEGGNQNQNMPNQEDPEPPPHIKEEQEQLQGLEEADITKFTFTPVPVKSEDDEEKPQSSQLHQRQTEHLETEADGEDCGGPEPARNSDPERHLQPETEDNPGDSSEPDTEDSADWKKTREPCSNSQINEQDPVSDSRRSAGEKTFICSICRKSFKRIGHLKKHMRIHTGEKLFSWSVCDKRYTQSHQVKSHKCAEKKTFGCSLCEKKLGTKSNLNKHMRIHTGEKPFSCSVCKKYFAQRGHLKCHMRIHTGEKQFSCSVCKKLFAQRGHLKCHMRIHTGEKQFSCSICKKSFAERGCLKRHMRVHTGEKPFSCSVCDKRFTWSHMVKSHACIGRQSSQLHQTQTEENRASSSSAEHMETEADGEYCGGPEPARSSDPERHLKPETEDNPGD